jgi:hypothetical protein
VNVDHLVCEGNHMESTWEGASWYFKYGWHIYHGDNTERSNFVGDREGFTYDNPGKSMLASVILAGSSGGGGSSSNDESNESTGTSTTSTTSATRTTTSTSTSSSRSDTREIHTVTLDIPFGCNPAINPYTPADGCIGWSGYTDVGNVSGVPANVFPR